MKTLTRLQAERQVARLEAEAIANDIKAIERLLLAAVKQRTSGELADLIEYATGKPVRIVGK